MTDAEIMEYLAKVVALRCNNMCTRGDQCAGCLLAYAFRAAEELYQQRLQTEGERGDETDS